MSKRGASFQREISKSLEKLRGWRYRPQDARAGTFVISPQPCDFLLLRKGRLHAFECKSSIKKTSFDFRELKEHQIENLLQIEEHRGESWVLICNRSKRGKHILYAMRIDYFLYLKNTSEKKSITWTLLYALADDKNIWMLEKNNESQTWPLKVIIE